MGMDAEARADWPRRLFFRARPEAVTQAITAAVRDHAETSGLGPLCWTHVHGAEEIGLTLVPVANQISIRLEDTGIVAHFQSQSAGPGYHAFAIEALEAIGARAGLTWSWRGADGPLDETGYAETRDFAALQTAVRDFALSLCRIVETEGLRPDALCVLLGLTAPDEGIACPAGLVPHGWTKAMAQATPEEQDRLAAGFYCWWDKGLTASAWDGLLRAMLWQMAQWRPPVDDWERGIATAVVHGHRQLARLGPVSADLEEAFAEWQALQTNPAIPRPAGIGFRKRPVRQHLYPGWTLRLPGWLRGDGDGERISFTHDGLTLDVSSLTATAPDPDAPFNWPETAEGPVMDLPTGVQCRKTAITEGEDGTRVQAAWLVRQTGAQWGVLIATLTSTHDWPFEALDGWLGTVTT